MCGFGGDFALIPSGKLLVVRYMHLRRVPKVQCADIVWILCVLCECVGDAVAMEGGRFHSSVVFFYLR